MIKMKFLFNTYCCHYFFFFFIFLGCTERPSTNRLSNLENKYLEVFFRHLFETTTAGYVLYGEKPLFQCSFKAIENTIPGTVEHKNAIIFTQGLNAWKKLNIQSKNFLLISIINNKDEHSQSFFIINKKALKKVIQKNLSLFQLKLGHQINEDRLLNGLLFPNGFSTILKGQEALQGILFGYGTENALTYERGNTLRKKIFSTPHVNPPFQYNLEPSTPDELKDKMTLYVNNQESNEQGILDELVDFSFYTPEIKDNVIPKIPFNYHTKSEESKKLLEIYKETEKTMITLQTHPDFLNKVIKRLQQ